MSKLVVGLGVVVAVAGGAALFIQQQSIAELRGEVALLRDESAQAAKLQARALSEAKAEAARQSIVVTEETPAARGAGKSELEKLREDVNGLKKSAQEFGKVIQAAQAKMVDASIPTKLVPVAEWKNGGRETPAAAVETVLWAATGGDVDLLSQGIVLSPSARAKADAWFAQLAESTKAQYGSPEKLISLMIAKDAAAVAGMQVLGQKELTADDVAMRVRFGAEDGKTKDDTFVLHRTNNAWALLLTDPVVEKFAKQLAGGGPGK